jgi:hypothetical protein
MTVDGEILIGSFPRARNEIFDSVNTERDRQEAKWGAQSWPNGTTSEYNYIAEAYKETCDKNTRDGFLSWHDILLEEVFEAMSEENPDALETELVQVIAVAVNWVEDIRRKRGH